MLSKAPKHADKSYSQLLASPTFPPLLGSIAQTLPSLPAVHTTAAFSSPIALKQVTSVLTLRIEYIGGPFRLRGLSNLRLSSDEIATSPEEMGTMS